VNTRKQQYTNTGTVQLLDDDLKLCSRNSSGSTSNRNETAREVVSKQRSQEIRLRLGTGGITCKCGYLEDVVLPW
jgi:hypothetical protein